MRSPSPNKENETQNAPIVRRHVHSSTWGFIDHLRETGRGKQDKPKSRYLEDCHFYVVLLLVGLMISSPLLTVYAQSGNSDGGGDGGEVDEEDAKTQVDRAEEPDDPTAQGVTSFDATITTNPVDPGLPGTPPVDPGLPGTPPVDPGLPGTPPVDPGTPQLPEVDSESISNMKKDVKKSEEILNLGDKKFVDGIISYAKERVGNDINEESERLLISLTPDETKELVSAQIQFIGLNLADMPTSATQPRSITESTTPPPAPPAPQPGGTTPLQTEIFPLAPGPVPAPTPDNDCLDDPSLPKCASVDSECLSEFGMNDEEQCFPTHDKCPNGSHSHEDDESGRCIPDKTPCEDGYVMNDHKNCVNKSFCEKHPKASECKSKNDNKNGNDKKSDGNHNHDNDGSNGHYTVIQSASASASANATVIVNTVNGTYVCLLEGIAAGTHQAFDMLKYQACGAQANGQKAYYDGFVQQCMQVGNSKQICEVATGVSSNMGKQSPQAMQQQSPQAMQQHVQLESQQQLTTKQIMGILNNIPDHQRQGILKKVDQSQLPKLIRASFPLAMTVVDVAPGSKVVKEITERPELHAVLNAHEKQVFLLLNADPTPEKLAEFLNLPPEKLPEFLNMLTRDELTQMFDMLPQDILTSVLNTLSNSERNRIETDIGGTAISSI
jgi:hypothetical protein